MTGVRRRMLFGGWALSLAASMAKRTMTDCRDSSLTVVRRHMCDNMLFGCWHLEAFRGISRLLEVGLQHMLFGDKCYFQVGHLEPCGGIWRCFCRLDCGICSWERRAIWRWAPRGIYPHLRFGLRHMLFGDILYLEVGTWRILEVFGDWVCGGIWRCLQAMEAFGAFGGISGERL